MSDAMETFKSLVEEGKIILIKSKKLNKLIYFIYKKKFKKDSDTLFKVKKHLAKAGKLFLDEEDMQMFVDSMDKKTMLQIFNTIRKIYSE